MFRIFLCFNGYLQNHSHISKQKQQRQTSHTADKLLKGFVHLLKEYAHRGIKDSRNSMKIFKNQLNFPSSCFLMLCFAQCLEEPHDIAIAQKYRDHCLLVLQNLLVTLYFLYFTLQWERTFISLDITNKDQVIMMICVSTSSPDNHQAVHTAASSNDAFVINR